MKLIFKIIGVLAAIGLLAAILIQTVAVCGLSAETARTRNEMSQAGIALQLYHLEYKKFPGETDNALIVQILEGDNPKKLSFYSHDHRKFKTGQFIDGWGKPLHFKANSPGMLIRSAGKDGIYYTPDDLVQEVSGPAST